MGWIRRNVSPKFYIFLSIFSLVLYGLFTMWERYYLSETDIQDLFDPTPTPMATPSGMPALTITPALTAMPTTGSTPGRSLTPSSGLREVFNDLNPETQLLELWRIERDWDTTAELAYHFQDPFSFDGRYIVSQQNSTLHVFDLRTNRVVKKLDGGKKPIWARHNHQLFYYRSHRIYRYDVAKDETVSIVEGVGAGYPRTISYDDRYIFTAYGGLPDGSDRSNSGEIYRIENKPGASVANDQVVQLTDEWQYASEPRASSKYDVIVFKQRHPSGNIERGWWAMPFEGTAKENYRLGVLLDKDFELGSHAAWLGDGEHFIMGNGDQPLQIRYLGRGQWDEWQPIGPIIFPSGDVAPLGYSGQWLVAEAGNESFINVVDMTSSRPTLLVHAPSEIIDKKPGDGNQGDPNPHGSPDGTKVAFVSNYDLKNCPTTQLTGAVTDYVPVQSTALFPSVGVLAIRHHLISYTSKTANSFEDITVGVLGTEAAVDKTWPGIVVTNFACRSSSITTLNRQYGQDLYIAVYRLPDTPTLSVLTETIKITPGKNHREIMGYKLHGPQHTIQYLSFPTTVYLIEGEYSVSAVEWSGLESRPSKPVTVTTGMFELVLD